VDAGGGGIGVRIVGGAGFGGYGGFGGGGSGVGRVEADGFTDDFGPAIIEGFEEFLFG
jgi:hypothetical protein